MIKQTILSLMITILSFQCFYCKEPEPLSKTMVHEVAEMTNDIADLIINSKTEKDPKITKSIVVRLISHIAMIANAVIEHKQETKSKRSLAVSNNQNDLILDNNAIEALATIILEKVNNKQDS